MRKKTLIFAALAASAVFGASLFGARCALAQGDGANQAYKRVKAPETYGTVVMDKNTRSARDTRAVVFPHWAHRASYSCKVCHTDLGFSMTAGATDIKQADINAGKYCGSCHDGKTAFGSNDCERCHSYGKETVSGSKIADVHKNLPKDDFGNKVNWARALKDGKIKPRWSLSGKEESKALDLDIVIPSVKASPHPPDVLFPHKAHTSVLDCSSCHPGIFKQKKGDNPDMNMMKIISGQYCGVCHGKVAFPQEDCFRCHSQPGPKIEEPAKEEKAKDTKKGKDEKKGGK